MSSSKSLRIRIDSRPELRDNATYKLKRHGEPGILNDNAIDTLFCMYARIRYYLDMCAIYIPFERTCSRCCTAKNKHADKVIAGLPTI